MTPDEFDCLLEAITEEIRAFYCGSQYMTVRISGEEYNSLPGAAHNSAESTFTFNGGLHEDEDEE